MAKRVIFHLDQETQDKILELVNLKQTTKSAIFRDCIFLGLPILEKRLKASRKVK